MRGCVGACVRACVRACLCACVRVCVCFSLGYISLTLKEGFLSEFIEQCDASSIVVEQCDASTRGVEHCNVVL